MPGPGSTNRATNLPPITVIDEVYQVPLQVAQTRKRYRARTPLDLFNSVFWRSNYEGKKIAVGPTVQDVYSLGHLEPDYRRPLEDVLAKFAVTFRTSNADRKMALWLVDKGGGFLPAEPVAWNGLEDTLDKTIGSGLEAMGLSTDDWASVRRVGLVLIFSFAFAINALTVHSFRETVRMFLTADGRQEAAIFHATPFDGSILDGRFAPADADSRLVFRASVDITARPSPSKANPPARASGGGSSTSSRGMRGAPFTYMMSPAMSGTGTMQMGAQMALFGPALGMGMPLNMSMPIIAM